LIALSEGSVSRLSFHRLLAVARPWVAVFVSSVVFAAFHATNRT
jgi:membrane protease YdiL (CAAX protease family)